MRKVFLILTAVAFVTMTTMVACGDKDNENTSTQNGNGNTNPPATQNYGTVTHGDKSSTLTVGEWGNDHKNILLHDQAMQTEVNINAADEIHTFNYTISTMADPNLLDGGKAWIGITLPGEGQTSVLSGTLNVTINGNNCTLTVNGTDRDGNTVTVTWQGALTESQHQY